MKATTYDDSENSDSDDNYTFESTCKVYSIRMGETLITKQSLAEKEYIATATSLDDSLTSCSAIGMGNTDTRIMAIMHYPAGMIAHKHENQRIKFKLALNKMREPVNPTKIIINHGEMNSNELGGDSGAQKTHRLEIQGYVLGISNGSEVIIDRDVGKAFVIGFEGGQFVRIIPKGEEVVRIKDNNNHRFLFDKFFYD